MVDYGPWLYFKLTNEPKGSGELKIHTPTNTNMDENLRIPFLWPDGY